MRMLWSSLLVASLWVGSSNALGQDRSRLGGDRWDIKTDNSRQYGGQQERDIEMRRRTDVDPTTRYRGTIENDGSTRMRDLQGNTLRGNIDSDGYGRLRDDQGNGYRVKPR